MHEEGLLGAITFNLIDYIYTHIYVYIKCIVTDKYASRVLEYNKTNSKNLYA